MKSLAISQAAPNSIPSQVKAASNGVQVFPSALNAAAAVVLTAPASGTLEQRRFNVEASGYATTVGAYNVTVGLYAAIAIPAVPLTAANWTLLKASTARAVGTTTTSWWLSASLIADAVDKVLMGTASFMINNLYDGHAALTNTLAAVNFAGSVEPAVYFAVGLTFSTADATNIGNLQNFYLAA